MFREAPGGCKEMTAYLDNSATTRPGPFLPALIRELTESGWYNPSALYKPSLEIQKRMDNVREACLQAAGAVGCGLESILFSPYGFSISWFVANLIIGLGCGIVFKKIENIWLRIAAIVGFVAVGMFGAKTGIECYLYHIPFAVKIVKNAVAFGVDTATMLIGLGISAKVCKYWK